MNLTNSARTALLTVSVLFVFFASFCPAQSASPAPASNPDPATQSPATVPPVAAPPQNKPPGDKSPSQSDSKDSGSKGKDGTEQQDAKKNDRMFYVMPNYLTVASQSQVKPVSAKEKFAMAAEGSFDPYEFTVVGILAGIRQAENSSPGFGQGMQGYAKRYGAAFVDQLDGNVMVGGVYPTILKTDPRYFQLGQGKFMHRFDYAISRIFVTRTDSGHSMVNIPEFAGNATAIAISNLYYPAADRNFSSNLSGWGTQMGLDALGNELKEFWPDIHRYLQRRHERHLEKKQQKAAE